MTNDSCIFCGIVAGDVPGTVVSREDRAVAFMDINPATRGHLLVATRTHIQDLLSADLGDVVACMELAQRMARRATDRLGADGVTIMQSNGSAAWQSVFHLHVHVIPRYAGDPLVLPWKPTAGDPDEIAETAARLTDG